MRPACGAQNAQTNPTLRHPHCHLERVVCAKAAIQFISLYATCTVFVMAFSREKLILHTYPETRTLLPLSCSTHSQKRTPLLLFFSFSQIAFQRELAVVLMHFNRSVRWGINLKQIFSTPRQTMLGASHCAHGKANPPCQCYTASPVTLDIGKSYRYSGEKINLLLLKYGFSFLLLLLLYRPLMVMLTPPHRHTTHSHERTNVSLHFYSI